MSQTKAQLLEGKSATIQFTGGSASAPSVSFTGDTNTGIYSPGADQVAISTNGTKRIEIQADGDIDIDNGGVFYDATNNRLAIGTTSPGQALHVIGNIQVGDSGNERGIYVGAAGFSGAFLYRPTGDVQLSPRSGYGITFAPAPGSATEWGRWDSSGRLLVGTSTGRNVADTIQSTLQVEGTSYNSISVVNNTNDIGSPALKFGKSRGTTNGSNTVVQNGDYLGAINFAGANGTNLENIAGSIACIVDATPGVNDMPGRLVFSTTADGASSPTERMRIVNNGVVIINNTTDLGAGLFQVNDTAGRWAMTTQCTNPSGGTYFHWNIKSDATNVGSVTTTTTTTSFNTSSDYRLKENISAVTNGIARLQQLKPSRFNFKIDPTKIVDGFIAHEVQTIVPEAIIGEKDAVDPDGNPIYQGIDQSKLVPLLTAALQEAVAKIESLEARLTAAGI